LASGAEINENKDRKKYETDTEIDSGTLLSVGNLGIYLLDPENASICSMCEDLSARKLRRQQLQLQPKLRKRACHV